MVSKNLPVLTLYTVMNFQSEEGIGQFSLSCLGQHCQAWYCAGSGQSVSI